MNFIANGMLGKLTRWLRMLGYDVKYSNKLDDSQLMMIAKKERRVLLTRDLKLYRQATAKRVDAFYLQGEKEEEKLSEVARRFNIELDIDMTKSRCPKCNTPVKPVSKGKVEGKVERKTFIHYDKFWQCPECSQIYWQGAHWKRIRKTLKTAKKILKKNIETKQTT